MWLMVRVVNRRERWAKRTLVDLIVGLPVLYVASLFPIAWMVQRDTIGNADVKEFVMVVYLAPVKWMGDCGPERVKRCLDWIGYVTKPDDTYVDLPAADMIDPIIPMQQ